MRKVERVKKLVHLSLFYNPILTGRVLFPGYFPATLLATLFIQACHFSYSYKESNS
jgi:hypothetical protein